VEGGQTAERESQKSKVEAGVCSKRSTPWTTARAVATPGLAVACLWTSSTPAALNAGLPPTPDSVDRHTPLSTVQGFFTSRARRGLLACRVLSVAQSHPQPRPTAPRGEAGSPAPLRNRSQALSGPAKDQRRAGRRQHLQSEEGSTWLACTSCRTARSKKSKSPMFPIEPSRCEFY